MSISGCIIAKNEEKNISACIDNISQFVDEIIVVDNGSSDKTAKIARSKNCIVVEENVLIWDLAKNRCLEKATKDWILSIDVDEKLELQYLKKLKELTLNSQKNIMGYTLPRYEYIGNGKWGYSNILRLFRNDERIRFNNSPIHNSPGPSIRAVGGTIEKANIPIHHFDILIKNRTINKRQIYREFVLKEIEIRKNSNDSYIYLLYNFLGIEYAAIQDYEKAEECYMKTLDWSKKYQDLGFYADLALLYLSQSKLMQNNIDDCSKYAEELILKKSGLMDRAYTVLAEVELRRGNISKSKLYCNNSLEVNSFQSHQYVNIASLSEDKKEIKECIEKAIKINSFLLNSEIYTQGFTPNSFFMQDVFLSSVKSVKDMVKSIDNICFN